MGNRQPIKITEELKEKFRVSTEKHYLENPLKEEAFIDEVRSCTCHNDNHAWIVFSVGIRNNLHLWAIEKTKEGADKLKQIIEEEQQGNDCFIVKSVFNE